MQAWRICKPNEVDDLSGRGAARFGGRWNHPEQAAIYLGLSAAACALDAFIQGGYEHRLTLKLVHLQLPQDPTLYQEPPLTTLPPGWDAIPADKPSMDFGSAWLERSEHLGLIVPSATIVHTRNLLLNPDHPAIAQIRLLKVSDLPGSKPVSSATY